MEGKFGAIAMVQAEYKTIFEIGIGSFPWGSLLHPVIFIVIGLILVRFAKGKAFYQIVGGSVASLAAFFFLLLGMRFVPDFVELRSAYRSGGSSIVKGTVEDFHPAPTLGGLKESFSVHGVVFLYYLDDSTPCFHNDGGPIRPGLDVQIYYKGDCIQRVDIRR